MISTTIPDNFDNPLAVSWCFIYDSEYRILLLKRAKDKFQWEKWWVPGGKINLGETALDAMIRETYEETGLNITPSDARHIKTYYAYVESNSSNLIYHEFSAPYNWWEITLSPREHSEFGWFTHEESLTLDLIHDMEPCIASFFMSLSH